MSEPSPQLEDLRIERNCPPAGRRRGLLLAAALAAAALLALAAWWWINTRPLELRTVAAREAGPDSGGARTVLNASGYVTARRAATVSSKITGKVMEVLIEEGVRVAEGQVLARLDDTNVQAGLRLAQAELGATQAALQETRVRLREAEQEWHRQKTLLAGAVATQADYDRAEAGALALRARLAQQETAATVAERAIAIWNQQKDDTVIRAPFAGMVTSKDAQPGEMISPMSSGGFTRTGICTIVDMDSLEIEIDVNESYINRVAPEQSVEAALDAYPEWEIPCRVVAIIPTADRQKSTVRVRVGFARSDPRILPEMSVKVAFLEPESAAAGRAGPVVIVPQSAVRNHDGRDVVFVIAEGRAERRAVTVLATRSGETELGSGLAVGEIIAADPPAELADGMAVKGRER